MIAAITREGKTTIVANGTLPEIYMDVTCIVEGVLSKVQDKNNKLTFVLGLVESLKDTVEREINEKGNDSN